MQTYFIINNEEIIKGYNKYMDFVNGVNITFKQLKDVLSLETNVYYENVNSLSLQLTEKDIESLGSQLRKYSKTDFKSNSKTAKLWFKLLKENGIEKQIRRPDLGFYIGNRGVRWSSAVWDYKGLHYGTFKTQEPHTLPDWATEIKASEYHKIAEDMKG